MQLVGVGTMATEGVEVDQEGELPVVGLWLGVCWETMALVCPRVLLSSCDCIFMAVNGSGFHVFIACCCQLWC